MNLNIITYSIYLPVIVFITVKVGWLFYKIYSNTIQA